MKESEESRNYASKLLKYRNRSEKEIREKLKQKKFNDTVIADTIGWLKEKKYLDDQQFTREWIESRKRKGYSKKYIHWELKQKGISAETVNLDFDEQEGLLSDKEVAKKLVEKKIKQYRNLEPTKVKQRIQNLLLRHGFSWEIIEEVLKKFDYGD
ncbi:MAG TPA: hypothetical protein DHV62_00075 [Elusimicrobia bacterium]|jgi:regulatory protein|nr:hypothetical protein [Elusimicrobiota bacterium]